MKLNVDEFKNVLRKGTMNYTIDSIGLVINKDHVKSSMISSDRTALVFLNLPNAMIEGFNVNDEVVWNFTEPNNRVKPYLEILDEEVVPITIKDDKIIVNKQLKMNFGDESVISMYGYDNPRNEFDYFVTMAVDAEFMMNYKKIQKIGSRFGKVYLVVKDNKLYIESTDKTNSYSNSVKLFICDVEHEDMELCFKYKSFVSMMSLVTVGDFNLNVCYVKDNNLGVVHFSNQDNSERYYLMSSME